MIPVVVGSSPIGHPIPPRRKTPPRKWRAPVIAEGATAGDALVANLRAALEQIGANTAGTAEGRDPEYLHQLRVGVRRLRSVLRAFRELLRRRGSTEVERSFRKMMRALGAARDWDVFHQSLSAGELRRRARSRQAIARRLARDVVNSPRFRGARLQAFAWAQRRPWRSSADPAEPLAAFARRALRRLHDALRESARGIDWRNAARRHKVRIKLKRLRYGCEFFAAGFPRRATRPFLERLRTLQDILGGMNDVEVQRRLLRELERDGRPTEATPAARARLVTRERALIAALGPAWAAFAALDPFWRRAASVRALG